MKHWKLLKLACGTSDRAGSGQDPTFLQHDPLSRAGSGQENMPGPLSRVGSGQAWRPDPYKVGLSRVKPRFRLSQLAYSLSLRLRIHTGLPLPSSIPGLIQ